MNHECQDQSLGQSIKWMFRWKLSPWKLVALEQRQGIRLNSKRIHKTAAAIFQSGPKRWTKRYCHDLSYYSGSKHWKIILTNPKGGTTVEQSITGKHLINNDILFIYYKIMFCTHSHWRELHSDTEKLLRPCVLWNWSDNSWYCRSTALHWSL